MTEKAPDAHFNHRTNLGSDFVKQAASDFQQATSARRLRPQRLCRSSEGPWRRKRAEIPINGFVPDHFQFDRDQTSFVRDHVGNDPGQTRMAHDHFLFDHGHLPAVRDHSQMIEIKREAASDKREVFAIKRKMIGIKTPLRLAPEQMASDRRHVGVAALSKSGACLRQRRKES